MLTNQKVLDHSSKGSGVNILETRSWVGVRLPEWGQSGRAGKFESSSLLIWMEIFQHFIKHYSIPVCNSWKIAPKECREEREGKEQEKKNKKRSKDALGGPIFRGWREEEDSKGDWGGRTRQVWCPRRKVTLWSSLSEMVPVGICINVINSMPNIPSQKCLYSDRKLCGLPTKKPSGENCLSGRNDQLFKMLLPSEVTGWLRTGYWI